MLILCLNKPVRDVNDALSSSFIVLEIEKHLFIKHAALLFLIIPFGVGGVVVIVALLLLYLYINLLLTYHKIINILPHFHLNYHFPFFHNPTLHY